MFFEKNCPLENIYMYILIGLLKILSELIKMEPKHQRTQDYQNTNM